MLIINFLKRDLDSVIQERINKMTADDNLDFSMETTDGIVYISINDEEDIKYIEDLERILMNKDKPFYSEKQRFNKDTICRKFLSKRDDFTFNVHPYYNKQYIELEELQKLINTEVSAEISIKNVQEYIRIKTAHEIIKDLKELV